LNTAFLNGGGIASLKALDNQFLICKSPLLINIILKAEIAHLLEKGA
jgi:hypothetical protein